ncbi:MAG: HAD family hydrolase [Solirubrobacteraceae bacterium]
MALLLFDIDGTLLLGAAALHRAAIGAALAELYGIADPRAIEIEFAGRTDDAIARELLACSGVAEPGERFAMYRDRCCEIYAAGCPRSLAGHVAPGVPELLESLAAHRLSLVTGNYEPMARLKLARAGIGGYFASGQGAFGSDAEDRDLLPAIARRRAGGHPRADTILIGDTPRDIACAHADGVRAIAIASGPFDARELAAADLVVADAHELRAYLTSLL